LPCFDSEASASEEGKRGETDDTEHVTTRTGLYQGQVYPSKTRAEQKTGMTAVGHACFAFGSLETNEPPVQLGENKEIFRKRQRKPPVVDFRWPDNHEKNNRRFCHER